MYTSGMYQQPMVIQITEPMHSHMTIKEQKDTVSNIPHRTQQLYQHNNNRPGGKKYNGWSNNYKYIRTLKEVDLTPSNESLPGHTAALNMYSDSFTDDSAKGVKRLHELNGLQPHLVHAYTLTTQCPQGYQSRRAQSVPPVYNKRRQSLRRNKHAINGTNPVEEVPDRYMARSQMVEVREMPRQLVCGSKWDQLSTDIWHKFMANQQTSNNYINKINLFKRIYAPIKTYLRYSVFIVGSTFNGFGTNTSDLDLCLVIRNQMTADVRQDAIQHLVNTHELLSYIYSYGGEIQKIELIDAKLPLLKFHSWGVDVDINCNNPVGIRNTHLLHCYAKADWRVQPLVLVVKLWANTHNINNAKNGTISSYSLALMVIHFLQYGTEPPVLPCLQLTFPEKFKANREIHEIHIQETLSLPATSNKQSLGELLLQFLQYYNNFKYVEDAISVRVGRTIPIKHCRAFPSPKNEARAWTYLCIEEPFDHTNTARAVYDQDKFELIRKVFEISFQRLNETRSLDSIFQFKVAT